MSLTELSAISRLYGADPDYVIAGGGNTSFKDDTTPVSKGTPGSKGTLWIKGSGVSLGEITPEGFVAMDRGKLAAIWQLSASTAGTPAEREAAVLAEMLAARKPGEEHKRPSVETLLHDLLPFAYVVHTHPSLVNGLGCSRDGEQSVRKLFGEEAVWIPISDPGFVLAALVKETFAKGGFFDGPAKKSVFFFLQNHGIFVGANTTDEIKSLYRTIMDTIGRNIKRFPDFGGALHGNVSDIAAGTDALPGLAEAAAELQKISGGAVVFARNNEFARLVESRAAFAPVSSAFTPDHIVYAGSDPLFIEKGENREKAWKAHTERTGRPPKIAALQGLGIFGLGASEKNAALAVELFTDAVKVAVYAESFGGPRFMTPEKIAFINNWEAEQYRAKQVR
ncbi:short-chain dehydrogenase [Spirochaetia bacterium]|nr:short-chain dehydrogenase [Spirochaetia bacterium]